MNVKFCGLSSNEGIETALDAGATHAGFVVQAPKSHRNLDLAEAAELAAHAPPDLTSVLVTPTDDPSAMQEALDEASVDVVQATGPIPAGELVDIADTHGVDAWKGIGLQDTVTDTVDVLDAYASADAIVLDALTDGYGGHGRQIDWGHAFQVTRNTNARIVLAGGLTPDNVADAIREVDPWCVDVSSGIETDERKDPDKMHAFAQAALGDVNP